MNSTIKEMKALCCAPNVCGICLKRSVSVHDHLCDDCAKISPRRLPIVILEDGKRYFFDKRLGQLRNILTPFDYIDLKGD